MCVLLTALKIPHLPLDRPSFNDDEVLSDALRLAGAVMHFAGVNRGTDEEIHAGNVELAERLRHAMDEVGSHAPVLFSSSIQRDRDNVYARSKNRAAQILSSGKAPVAELVLPHIFGEGGRENYNSVIQTFCARAARGASCEIAQDGEIEPIHAQRLCEKILEILRQGRTGLCRVEGRTMSVSQMLSRLEQMAETYRTGILPDLRDDFDLDLFNTYRSYLYPGHYPVQLTRHSDPRGSLVEMVKEKNGGQVFFSTTVPGITRGNHFHRHKVERFLVVSGEADIQLRHALSDDVTTFPVTGDAPAFVDIPTLHAHSITNTGAGELLTLFWVHELFDPDRPDTYAMEVRS